MLTRSVGAMEGRSQELPIILRGQVTDAITGTPLEGVEIIDRRCKTTITYTDINGNYEFVWNNGCAPTVPNSLSVTYSKPGYRFEYRPSFENQPDDTAANYAHISCPVCMPVPSAVNVVMHPYKESYRAQILQRELFRGKGGQVALAKIRAATFQSDDILLVDIVSTDHGSDQQYDVNLKGDGVGLITLMTGQSKAGRGGHLQMYGEISNQNANAVDGFWHLSFTHNAPWPDQSESADFPIHQAVASPDWIQEYFTVEVIDNTSTCDECREWEWQVVKLTPLPRRVAIDIKPDSDPNSINLKSKGVIPVAILSDADFSAITEINVSTLRFGPEDAEPGDGAEAAHLGHVDDVNEDGFLDAVIHFPTQDTGIWPDDTVACVTGTTVAPTPEDATPIAGCDDIRITPGSSRGRGN